MDEAPLQVVQSSNSQLQPARPSEPMSNSAVIPSVVTLEIPKKIVSTVPRRANQTSPDRQNPQRKWNKLVNDSPILPPPTAVKRNFQNSLSQDGPSGDSESHARQQFIKLAKLELLSSVSELVCIELCAGSAGLSSALRKIGFQVLPIDHSSNRHDQKVKSIQIDLSERGAMELITAMMDTGKIFYIHCGPPCGTASRARDKPVSAYWLARGAPSPKPLRNSSYPRGLPNLSSSDQVRVDKANRIYDVVCQTVLLCIKRKIIFSVENPASSYMWDIKSFVDIRSMPEVSWVLFHSCMHGGSRPKHTALLCSANVFESLGVLCDGSHTHEPWGMHASQGRLEFDTALEAEYPREFCESTAQLVLNVAIKAGYSPMPESISDPGLSESQQRLLQRAQTGKLPRGRRLPQLVPEFSSVTEQLAPPDANDKQFRLLRRFSRLKLGDTSGSQSGETETVYIVGKYRTPQEFMDAARNTSHPMESVLVPDVTIKAIFDILTFGPVKLAGERVSTLRRIKRMAEELQPQEDLLHEAMDPHVRTILAGKRLLLFQRLLDESGYRDSTLSKDIAAGFPLTGRCQQSNEIPTRIVPATLTQSELLARSNWSRRSAFLDCNGSDGESEQVWIQCKEECAANWIRGPYDEGQVDGFFPTGWACSKRFGLPQGSKVRVIDDCKRPCINDALTTVEKLDLMDIDSLAAILRFIQTCADEQGCLSAKLSNGQTLEGKIHPDWKGSICWQGRTLDLRAAYKALAVHPDSRWAAVLLAWNHDENKRAFFISDSLLFGCTAAVYAFNRASRGIWHIASHYCRLVTTVFYDDFPSLEPSQTAKLSKQVFETLLGYLGWEWSCGTKDLAFADVFSPLGVQVNLSTLSSDGSFQLSNKPSRVRDQVDEIDGILKCGSLPHFQAASLHGKLQYSEAQIFGRASVAALRVISQRAFCGPSVKHLNPVIVQALLDLSANLRLAAPRTISNTEITKPILMFTDGAAELDGEGWGALLWDLHSDEKLVAGGSLPTALSEHYRNVVGTQIIGQVELYPIILCRHSWAQRLNSRRVIWFIDNDAARDGLISGFSPSPASMALISVFYAMERGCPTYPWMARVPSHSNPADLPSRKKLMEAAKLYQAKVEDLGQLPDKVIRDLLRIVASQ